MTRKEQEHFYDYLLSKPWTVIAVSDDTSYLERADRIFFMDKGELKFEGKLNELKSSDYVEYIR
jgi:ABC-type multidrug transport system ATPase subunit